MKEVKLTQGYVALVDDEDYERVSQHKWCARIARRKDGSIQGVYAVHTTKTSRSNGKRKTTNHFLHKFILGSDETSEVDHRDNDGLNNQRYNLRKATKSDNQHNTRKQINNTSGYKGVYWHKRDKAWRAMVGMNSKLIYLGTYSTPEQAAAAYDEAARRLFGEFAKTNF